MKMKDITTRTAMELALRLNRLQFNEEAGTVMPGDVKEMAIIKTELRRKLVVLLGRDFYPPNKEVS